MLIHVTFVRFSFHAIVLVIALVRLTCLFLFLCHASLSFVFSCNCFVLPIFVKAGNFPKALILGHSFVKRLSRDIGRGFHDGADLSFGLDGSVLVHLHGVGGRTVEKLRIFDMSILDSLAPDIVILKIGTNDLTCLPQEVVGSAVEELV